jgi:hypothetical protein
VLLSVFWNSRTGLRGEYPSWAGCGLRFWPRSMVYNWTEAGYKAMHPVFFLLFIVAMEYPMLQANGCRRIGPENSA